MSFFLLLGGGEVFLFCRSGWDEAFVRCLFLVRGAMDGTMDGAMDHVSLTGFRPISFKSSAHGFLVKPLEECR